MRLEKLPDGTVNLNATLSEMQRIISLTCYVKGDYFSDLYEDPQDNLHPDDCLHKVVQVTEDVLVDDKGRLEVFNAFEVVDV